ncbi:MAG: xanthine dehydrogenase [Gemmatimonadetes bacterium]|nr:xanthine dehydrogenase [Gemmatimonadota bacterium]
MTSSKTPFRGFVDRVKAHQAVAVATVLEGPDGVGSKILFDRSGPLQGSLGSRDLDALAEARAKDLLASGRSEIVELAGHRVFIEVHLPPPRLVIVGAVHIATVLGRFARELGFRVVVSDARGRFATPERFPEVDELILGWPNEVLPRLGLDEFSYVVVITHDAKLDNPSLLAALRSPAPYIGALGSSRTHARRVNALKEAGATEKEIARIHAPIGLEIGARAPNEIALAIMAQIVAVRNGAEGGVA